MGVQITFNTETLTTQETLALIGFAAALAPEDSVTTWATRWLDNATLDGVDPDKSAAEDSPRVVTWSVPIAPNGPLTITAISEPLTIVEPSAAEAFASPPLPAPPAMAPDSILATPGLAPAVASVELDTTGLPWDARIHAATRAKNADGSWRTKRGADKDEVATVSAHLRALVSGEPLAPPPPVAEPTPDVIPPPPAVPVTPPPPPPPVAAPSMGPAELFSVLMRKITPLQSAGRLTAVAVNEACAAVGVAAVRDLLHRPDLIPAMEKQIDDRTV